MKTFTWTVDRNIPTWALLAILISLVCISYVAINCIDIFVGLAVVAATSPLQILVGIMLILRFFSRVGLKSNNNGDDSKKRESLRLLTWIIVVLALSAFVVILTIGYIGMRFGH